jgi:hypothetical protein
MALTTHVRRPLRRARTANRIRNLGCTCDGTIIEQKALLSRELLSPSTATQTPLFDVNNAADPTSNNSEARFASANTWLNETALARGWGLMCQSRLTRRSLLRAESSCPNKAAKPCEPPSLLEWRKGPAHHGSGRHIFHPMQASLLQASHRAFDLELLLRDSRLQQRRCR